MREFYLKSDALWNTSIDYSGYRDYVRMVGSNKSRCQEVPPSSAIIVYANEGLIPFVQLQKKAMVIGNSYSCLRSIFVVVCLDQAAYSLCKDHTLTTAYMLDCQSSFRSQSLQKVLTTS